VYKIHWWASCSDTTMFELVLQLHCHFTVIVLFNFWVLHIRNTTAAAAAAVLWPLHRTTYISWHPQLRTGVFCCSKLLLHACPCWQQLVHSYYGENARVINSVTCTISVLSQNYNRKLCLSEFQMGHTCVHLNWVLDSWIPGIGDLV